MPGRAAPGAAAASKGETNAAAPLPAGPLAAPLPAAAAPDARPSDMKSASYELFMLLISLLSLTNAAMLLLCALALGRGGPAQEVLVTTEFILTPIFAFDVLYRLHGARRGYLARGGWADGLAVVPLLRAFRLVRVAAVLRIWRRNGRQWVVGELATSRALSTFLVTIFLVVAVVETASATIYYAENGAPGANIASAGDAIWWGLVTITTVGYGDRYPVTTEGRAIGVFLLFAGIGLFSVLTGFIANAFLAPRRRRRPAIRPDAARDALDAIRGLLTDEEERLTAIRGRLDELELSMLTSAPPERSTSTRTAETDETNRVERESK